MAKPSVPWHSERIRIIVGNYAKRVVENVPPRVAKKAAISASGSVIFEVEPWHPAVR
jgi:hypothetical protein